MNRRLSECLFTRWSRPSVHVEKRDGKESERSWALDHGEFVQVSEPAELARIKALTAAIRARRDRKYRRFKW